MPLAIAVIALVILLLFAVFLIALFSGSVLEIIINLPLLWALIVRSHVEIKAGRRDYFMLSAIFVTLTFMMLTNFHNLLFIWWVTQLLLLIYLGAWVLWFIDLRKKSSDHKKRRSK